jgi:hypothetical protein
MHQIHVSDIVIDVVRKDIKNLHLAVYPPDGRVRIATPLRVDDEAVRLFAITRMPWIKKQRRKLTAQPRQAEREYVSRESHYFQGRRYLLNVIHHTGAARVELRNKTYIDLYVRENSTRKHRKKVLEKWYREQLMEQIPALIAKWEAIMDVEVSEWRIRKMKTRWGTCNIQARRIWLNLELTKKSIPCLEYVIVHEMTHFHERLHNDRFVALMNRYLPQWRHYRDELNKLL